MLSKVVIKHGIMLLLWKEHSLLSDDILTTSYWPPTSKVNGEGGRKFQISGGLQVNGQVNGCHGMGAGLFAAS